MDNTKVLACTISEKLHGEMKQYASEQGKTVKRYITELIEEDLKRRLPQKNNEEQQTKRANKRI